jgi:hypothetical protein
MLAIPERPLIHRTQSAPASAAFLSSAVIRQAASSRRTLARANTSTVLQDSAHELVNRMPLDSSSPVKAYDPPALKRSSSFTLEWAATQSATFRPQEQAVLSRQPSKQLYMDEERDGTMKKRHKLSALSISLSNPSPFLRFNSPIEMVQSPTSYASLDGLLHAAKALEPSLPSPSWTMSDAESGDSVTDEETSVAAKRRGGDESFSSVGTEEGAGEEMDQECASLLLGLCSY